MCMDYFDLEIKILGNKEIDLGLEKLVRKLREFVGFGKDWFWFLVRILGVF